MPCLVFSTAQINLVQPQNGNRAEVYGIELGVFHTFSYLPGPLENLGFIGNITFQDTTTNIGLATLAGSTVDGDGDVDFGDILVDIGDAAEGDQLVQAFQFFNSPNITANAALFLPG